MATPNYGWEKRQRELAKKKKKEEKAQRKAEQKHAPSEPGSAAADDPLVKAGEVNPAGR